MPSRFQTIVSPGWILAIWFATAAGTAKAAITVRVESPTLAEGASPVAGFVDVYFEIGGPDHPRMAGYQIRIDLLPNDGRIQLGSPLRTNASLPARTPVFPTDPHDAGSDAGKIMATDLALTGDFEVHDQDGLIRIPFMVAAHAVGEFGLLLNQRDTAFSNDLGEPIGYTPIDGRITILAVPEPDSVTLGAMVGLALVASRPRRRFPLRTWLARGWCS